MTTIEPRAADATSIELVFRPWGRLLEPRNFTVELGIEPARTFEVGESRGPAAAEVAGWEGRSGHGVDTQLEPELSRMLQVLGPHRHLIRREVDRGADASLTLVGHIRGQVVTPPDAAATREEWAGDASSFKPYFGGERVEFFIDHDVLSFLAEARCSFATHVDIDLV